MNTPEAPSILIVAGESSGEKYGAGFIKSLKSSIPEASFFGVGGKRMREEGTDLLYTVSDLAVVGIFEVFSQLPRLNRIFNRILREAGRRRPDAALLIDSPDFNLRLAKKLSRLSIPVFYYISPTVWAWRKRRLNTIKKYIHKMLLIFPFEETLYREQGIPAVFVGHPLLQRIHLRLNRKEFCSHYGLDSDRKIIALLPGSRKTEISSHMPVLTSAIPLLKKKYDPQFILILAEDLSEDILAVYPEIKTENVRIISSHVYEALKYSNLAWSACGTANLEAALLETPVVSFYRIHPLTYYLGRPFVRLNHFSIVNILAGKKIIPELIQSRMNAENLVQESIDIFNSYEIRTNMILEFRRIRNSLGNKNSFDNAAGEMAKYLAPESV